jgi:hypothetical protein
VKKILYIAIVFVLLSACSQGATPEEKAAQAAQEYFTLLKDNPEAFLDARVGADSLPAIYRAQMKKVYEQFVSEINEKHGGIREVRISENVGRRDTVQGFTYAFLTLCFNDSIQEEIAVPIVEKDGLWLMK